jgi:hypothetical protein
MRRTGLLFVIAAAAGAAYVVSRAREIAETEQRPLADVLMEMPGRLAEDIGSFGDDVRDAADEGRTAAEREAEWVDDDLAGADQPADPVSEPDADADDDPTQ